MRPRGIALGFCAVLYTLPRVGAAETARAGRAVFVQTTALAVLAPPTLGLQWKAQVPGILLEEAVLSDDGTLHLATADGDQLALPVDGTLIALPAVEEALTHGPVAFGRRSLVLTGTRTPFLSRSPSGGSLVPLVVAPGRLGALPSTPPPAVISDGGGGGFLARGARWFHVSGPNVLADGTLPSPIAALVSLAPAGALAFDTDGRVHVLGAAPSAPIVLPGARIPTDGVPLPGQAALVTASDGVLLRLDLHAMKAEVLDLPRAATAPVRRPGGVAYVDGTGTAVLLDEGARLVATAPLAARSAVLVGLAGGAVAVATTSAEVFVLSAAGDVGASGKGCDMPLALLAAPGRLVLTCRDGSVLSYGTTIRAERPSGRLVNELAGFLRRKRQDGRRHDRWRAIAEGSQRRLVSLEARLAGPLEVLAHRTPEGERERLLPLGRRTDEDGVDEHLVAGSLVAQEDAGRRVQGGHIRLVHAVTPRGRRRHGRARLDVTRHPRVEAGVVLDQHDLASLAR